MSNEVELAVFGIIIRHCEKNPNNFDAKNQTILGFEPKKEGDKDGGQLVVVHFDKEACRLGVAKYIVLDELSFRHVEHEGFRELVCVLVSQLQEIFINSIWMRKRS